MALGIPLPGQPGESLLKGIQTGGNLFSQIMHPKIEREKQRQLEEHFKQELALRKAAAGRASQAASDAHKLALMKLDPNTQINQLLALQKAFGGGQPTTTAEQLPSSIPNFGVGQYEQQSRNPLESFIANAMPEQQNESFVPGVEEALQKPIQEEPQQVNPMAMESPQINPNAVSEFDANKNTNKIDMEMIKNSPILRGWFKKHYGIDPGKESVLTGAARDAESMQQLRQMHGKDSPIVKEAEAINKSKIRQHEDLSNIRQRQMNGLKPGDTPIIDPNSGEMLGFRKQLSDKQRDQAKNTVLFNETFPYVYRGAEKLSGPGATEYLHNAARNYKTDPASRKIIDDFLIAEKGLTTTAVTEASRFNAGHTNQTYNRYVETLKSEDIPKKLKKWIKEFEIPAEAYRKAGERWQKILNKAEEKALKSIPANYSYYFDPAKQFAEQQKKQSSQNEEPTEEESESITKILPNGKSYKMINGSWHEKK